MHVEIHAERSEGVNSRLLLQISCPGCIPVTVVGVGDVAPTDPPTGDGVGMGAPDERDPEGTPTDCVSVETSLRGTRRT